MLALVVLLLLINFSLQHDCAHDELLKENTPVYVNPQVFDDDRKRATVQTHPLRVHFDTTLLGVGPMSCRSAGGSVIVRNTQIPCTQARVLTQSGKNALIRVLADLKKEFAAMLNIVRPSQPLALNANQRWCYDESFDLTKYSAAVSSGPRMNHDMIIVVSAWPSVAGELAWAGYCRTNQFGRPIAGHANAGPSQLAGASYQYLKGVMMHEVMHALGFVGERMSHFLDNNGRVFNALSTATIRGQGVKNANILTAPKVVEKARKYFKCNTMQGMEIEDHGSGSAGSHWEQRIFGNEIMTPQISGRDREIYVSEITLAYFESMGVYYPNYGYAKNPSYGLGQGCDFVLGNPGNRKTEDGYKCTNQPANQCSHDGDAYSTCQRFEFSQCIPSFYRPESDCRKGGNQYSDYVVEPGAYAHCSQSGDNLGQGQSTGPTSRCFTSDVLKAGWSGGGMEAKCFPVKCSGGAGPSSPNPPPPPPPPPPQQPIGVSQRDICFTSHQDCQTCTSDPGCGTWCDVGGRNGGLCADTHTNCGSGVPFRGRGNCAATCSYQGQAGDCRPLHNCQVGLRVTGSICGGSQACCIENWVGKKRSETVETVELDEAMGKVDLEVVEQEEEEKPSLEKRNTGAVQIQIGGKWHNCEGDIRISGDYQGTVKCPRNAANSLCCAHLNYCSNRGTCVRGHCQCDKGATGDRCDQSPERQRTSAPSRAGWNVNNFAKEASVLEDPGEQGKPITDEQVVLLGEGNGNNTGNGNTIDATPIIITVVVVVIMIFAIIVAGVIFLVAKKRVSKN